MKKIIICIMGIISLLSLSLSAYAGNNMFIDDNFDEVLMLNHWVDDTGRGSKQIETDGSNNYLAMTASSSFFNFQAKDVYATKRLYFSADIKFTESNMEIQLRQSRDISASGFIMAGRLRKNLYYIEYFSNGTYYKLNDINGKWLQMKDISKWYTINMVLDIPTNTYSILLSEKDTGKTIGEAQNIPFFGKCDYINYFAFSSSDKLCVDNVKIEEIDTDSIRISGAFYPQITKNASKNYTYSVLAKDENNSEFIVDGVSWSLNRQAKGVAINEKTGELTIEPTAKPGIFIIYAKNILYPDIKKSLLIDIER